MAQTIKLKRSSTSGAVPTTSQLELGEVAINTYDGKMYIKKNVGGTETIVDITGGGSSSSADSIVQEYQYTATAGQTTFSGADDNSETLAYTAGAIQIFLNGVLLDPSTDYTASNTINVVLTSAAAVGDYLQIFAFKKKISDGNVSVDTFSGNNSTTAFTLSLDPGDENNTRVFIDGVYQSKSNYTVSGTTLTFSSAPPSGTAIEVEIGNRNVTLDTTANLDLPDNVKLRLGTSQDLEIYHDASDSLINDNGTGSLKLQTGGSTKLEITSSGVDVTGNVAVSGTVDGVDIAARDAVLTSTTTTAGAALPRTGGAMTGAITTNSTFDGRDVATDGAKLDGIEAGATADQTQSEINALGITATGLSGTPAISVANITTTGELRGPASFVVDPAAVGDNTGTVIIKGNLQVDGATTTINSTTLTVDDLNITLASGAANGTAANGAGITVDGASATITYNSTGDSWDFNKPLNVQTNLLISSSASNSIISESGSGGLFLRGSSISVQNSSNANMIQALSAGAVTLYHNSAPKIATSSTGITVTGSIAVSGNVDGVDIAARDTVLTSTTTTANAALPKAGGTLTGNLIGTTATFTAGNGDQLALNNAGERFTQISLQHSSTQNGALWLDDTDSMVDLYANTSHGIRLKTGGDNPRVTILSGGNVGIGTTTPGEKLEVNGALRLGQSSSLGTAQLTHHTNNFMYIRGGSAGAIISDDSGINTLRVADGSSGYVMVETGNGTERMRIDSSGRVGIGTSSPPNPLSVRKTTTAYEDVISIIGQNSPTDIMGALAYDQSTDLMVIRNDQTYATGGIAFRAGGTSDHLFIKTGGNVGIGTSTPGWPLDVGGYQSSVQFQLGRTNNSVGTTWMGSDSTGFHLGTGTYSSGGFNIASPALKVLATSGNVGIGTASPGCALDIERSTGWAEVHLNGASGGDLILQDNGVNYGEVYAGSGHGMVLKAHSGQHMHFLTDGDATAKAVITSAGNVGIGTSSPESLLTLENDDATLRIRSATTTTKGLTLRYNDSGNFGQLLVDHQGNNQLAMKYYALSHSFGRSDSDVNITMDDSGRLLIGSTTTDGSSSERFLVKSTGSNHSRFVNSSDTFSTVYIKNNSTTADTNQPFLTFQDTGGNRGNFGLRYSTAQLVIQGHGGVGIATGSGAFQDDPDLFVNTSGNVGIGTTSPSTYSKLHVKGATGAITSPGLIYAENTDDAYALYIKNAGNSTQNDRAIFEAIVGSTSVLRVNNSGNVGIGTASPTRSLVLSKGDSTGVQTQYTNSTTGVALGDGFTVGIDSSENAELWNFENTDMLFATSATERWRIDAGGALTGTRGAIGKVIGENISWNGTSYSNINTSYGASFLQLSDTGALYFRKTSAGSGNQAASYVFTVDGSGHITPGSNATQDIGSSSLYWRDAYLADVYTQDLHLSNEGREKGGNDIDGTKGNWTIQEGEENLYIINNKTGKKYKFALEEIS